MSWYLVQTKPRREYTAKENLERQGYTTYLPLILLRRRRSGRSCTAPGPMFPRYLFISLHEGVDDWRPIRSTTGVSSLVRFGQQAACVPDTLITTLQSREDDAGIQRIPERVLREGDRVRIAEGPFEGYEAVIEAASGKQRVILLLQLLERNVRLDVGLEHLELLA